MCAIISSVLIQIKVFKTIKIIYTFFIPLDEMAFGYMSMVFIVLLSRSNKHCFM